MVQGIQEIGGVRYVIVRDPDVRHYMENLDWFVNQRVAPRYRT